MHSCELVCEHVCVCVCVCVCVRVCIHIQAIDHACEDAVLALDKALHAGLAGLTLDQYLKQVRCLTDHTHICHSLKPSQARQACSRSSCELVAVQVLCMD